MLFIVALSAAGTGAAAASEEAPAAGRDELERRLSELEEQSRALLVEIAELRGLIERQAAGGVAAEPSESAAATLPVSPSAPDAPLRALAIGDSRLELYGFVRLDSIFDAARPDNPQSPTFVPSGELAAADDDQLNLHPRLTRVGLRLAAPGLAGSALELTGNLEVDFQNGGRESRQVPRMRHGWLRLAGEEWSLLAGQTWDVISPLFPSANADTLMWNAGNLGDRRPQLRVEYRPQESGLSFAGALGLTGAIDAQDLDADGVRDGDDSSLPNVQLRVGSSGAWRPEREWSLGLWGHHAWEETARPVAGRREFDSRSIGLDARIELSERLTLSGEVWTGSNLSDVRGGIGQGIAPSTGEEIDSRGGWIELGVRASDRYSLFAGATVDDPDDDEVPAGGRTENRVWYLVQRVPLWRSLQLGLDYLHWTTEHEGLEDGSDDRFNLYLVYGL